VSETPMRWYQAVIIAAILLGGCSTTPRELRATDPVFTRTATGEPEAFARCVQEDLEDKHGGAFGTMGGVAFETRHEGTTVRLLGRSALIPSQARVDLAIAPIGPGQVEVQLRMAGPRWPQESAVTCAGPLNDPTPCYCAAANFVIFLSRPRLRAAIW